MLWVGPMKRRVEKISRLLIWVEPALNHEMVCAILVERQTSDCDVKCRITYYTILGPRQEQYEPPLPYPSVLEAGVTSAVYFIYKGELLSDVEFKTLGRP